MLNHNPDETPEIKRIVIVGGGTAGWLTACVLAAEFHLSDDFTITLVESPDTPTIGVGEGTWPSMRSTLKKIGINEAEFLRRCQGSLKQGTFFRNWLYGKGESYYHPFSTPTGYAEANLAEVWLEADKPEQSFAHTVTPQCRICDEAGTAKQLGIPDYAYALNYGYHLDAGAFAAMLSERAVDGLGVTHIVDHVSNVVCDADGYIQTLETSKGVALSGDLFIDCSGFSALLIGKHYDIPLTGVDSILFNDRALATQMPYPSPEDSIKSTTWASAQTAGWVWDIGLRDRRGIGYVFSSAHTEEEAAEQVLEDYLRLQTADCKEDASWSAPRLLAFQPGYRETFWHKNCVAIGMAAGFVEPLEASALVLVELGARAIADRFPSHRQAMTVQADRYNREFTARWEHIVEFLKLHYLLSKREDSDYWRDHRRLETIPTALQEKLMLWQTEIPWHGEDQRTDELFPSASYQYVLMGMGFKTHRSQLPRKRLGQQRSQSQQLFQDVQQQAQRMSQHLPSNRRLLSDLLHRDFATL